jgi:hypothetical protein
MVVGWERLLLQNHWFDALYNACAAGHGVGVRLVEEVKAPPPPRSSPEPPEQIARFGGPESLWTAGRPDRVFNYRRWRAERACRAWKAHVEGRWDRAVGDIAVDGRAGSAGV